MCNGGVLGPVPLCLCLNASASAYGSIVAAAAASFAPTRVVDNLGVRRAAQPLLAPGDLTEVVVAASPFASASRLVGLDTWHRLVDAARSVHGTALELGACVCLHDASRARRLSPHEAIHAVSAAEPAGPINQVIRISCAHAQVITGGSDTAE